MSYACCHCRLRHHPYERQDQGSRSIHQQQEDHRQDHLRLLPSELMNKTKNLYNTLSGINEAKISLIIPFRL